MGANPKPGHGIAFAKAKRTVPTADADGMDLFPGMDALEMKARVRGILLPQPKSLSRLVAYIFGQGVEMFPERLRRMRVHSGFVAGS
jgi:hypothetical protein